MEDEEYTGAWNQAAADPQEKTEWILEITEGLLYWKGMLWIPKKEGLIQTILESEHDTKVAGHMGQSSAKKWKVEVYCFFYR